MVWYGMNEGGGSKTVPEERNAMRDTKTRILETAERLIVEQGVRKPTVRMIAAEADVNVAAINYHFGSKGELENVLLERFMEPIEEKRLAMLEEEESKTSGSGPSLEAIIRAFLLPFYEFRCRHPARNIFLSLYNMFDDDSRYKMQLRKIAKPTIRRFAEALIRSLPDVPRDLVLYRYLFLWMSVHAFLAEWLEDDIRDTFGMEIHHENLLEDLVSFTAYGFRARGRQNRS